MITWPSSLPLPLAQFSGRARTSTISSPPENDYLYRRSRYIPSYSSLSVSWNLGLDEFEDFKTFFQDTLYNGAALFQIDLRTPRNSLLDTWVVRFGGSYVSEHQEGRWMVTAEFDLVRRIVGYVAFEVTVEDSSGGYESFTDADGLVYFVKE